MTAEHLATVKAKCHCGEPASVHRRVPGCRCVISRCGAHEQYMDQQVKEHRCGR